MKILVVTHDLFLFDDLQFEHNDRSTMASKNITPAFLKKNLSVMLSFTVMLLPLNSTDLQNGGTMKTMFSYNTIENISLSLYIKLNFCHS